MQHEAYVVDVDSSGRDVGGDECLDLATLEVVERALTNCLATGTVQRASLDTSAVEVFADIVDTEAGLHEHHRRAVLFDECNSGVDALGGPSHDETMIDRCLIDISHEIMTNGIFHVVANQLLHITVERGGPQHGLARVGSHVEDLAHVGHKPEVGHAVGFVDDTDLDGAEVAVTLVDDVDETTRCCHDHRSALT